MEELSCYNCLHRCVCRLFHEVGRELEKTWLQSVCNEFLNEEYVTVTEPKGEDDDKNN